MESCNTDRHKKVQCTICGGYMQSDKLKRHSLTHKDILSMSAEEVRAELQRRNTIHTQQEERRQKVVEIAQQEGIPIDCCDDQLKPFSCDMYIQSLRADLLKGNQEYLDKIELGRKITMIIGEGTVKEESLTKNQKDALYLYRKQRSRRDIVQVELRPWQQELMSMIATPTARGIIWVQGMRGNEGKSWFQAST